MHDAEKRKLKKVGLQFKFILKGTFCIIKCKISKLSGGGWVADCLLHQSVLIIE
jgi:hypothetical protein